MIVLVFSSSSTIELRAIKSRSRKNANGTEEIWRTKYWSQLKKAIEKDYNIFLNAIFIKPATMSRLVKCIWKYHCQKGWASEFSYKYRERGNRDISFEAAACELYCIARYYTALHQWFCIVRYFVWKTLRYKILRPKYIIMDHIGEIFCLLICYRLSLIT